MQLVYLLVNCDISHGCGFSIYRKKQNIHKPRFVALISAFLGVSLAGELASTGKQ